MLLGWLEELIELRLITSLLIGKSGVALRTVLAVDYGILYELPVLFLHVRVDIPANRAGLYLDLFPLLLHRLRAIVFVL